MSAPIILLAGASGDLGGRIAKALVTRGAALRALMRADASDADKNQLATIGATIAKADVTDVGSTAVACAGAACVVSALNGLHDAIVERQCVLLDAAVKAGVPRFISSDYSLDFTKTKPGGNRNLDLRREFMARADQPSIRVTSILNGAFMDMLGAEMPIIQPRIRCVLYWRSADQPLDFTTKDDVAAYTCSRCARRHYSAHPAHCRRDRHRAANRPNDERGERRAVSHTLGRRDRLARCPDPHSEARRAAARRYVPALAGHAVHARYVQRARQTPPARQRSLPGHPLDVSSRAAQRGTQVVGDPDTGMLALTVFKN
ncbi:MAG: NmrA family NAD(P)-binding protein, partial [Pyrinomonadaceae bacterium]